MVNSCDALDARNAVAFEQELEDHFGLLHRQVHAVQRLLSRLREDLAALLALEALVTLAVVSVRLAFDPAVVAGHCESP